MVATIPFPARADQCRDAKTNAEDIGWLIDRIAQHYAYLPERHVDMGKLRAIYLPRAAETCEPHAFLNLLERLLAEFHDHHIEANVNNADSPQLVPTGAEMWAAFQGGEARIEAVLPDSSIAKAGVRAGHVVTAIAGKPVREAVAAAAPRALSQPDPEADDYTLRVLLAGTHKAARDVTVRDATGLERRIRLPPHAPPPSGAPLTLRDLGGGITCLRIENSLGDGALVPAMDSALDRLAVARGLILDLRNTPSGGNTDVAEPILGRFIAKTEGYQRGRAEDGKPYLRKVQSRGKTVTAPLVVLCGRWTGSMGEGMTIGLDGMKRATVVGTRMAGLCGATAGFTLPHARFDVHFPTERLYHLDGTPREHWAPPVLVDLARATGEDPILTRGLAVLHGG